MLLRIIVGLSLLLSLMTTAAAVPENGPADATYEQPQWHPADALTTAEQKGDGFTVRDPITTDGLMPRYVIDAQSGVLHAYGHAGLLARLREVRALAVATHTSDLAVVAGAAGRHVKNSIHSVGAAASNPIGVVTGIPHGIVNLFKGTAAQVREFGRDAQQTIDAPKTTDEDGAGTPNTTRAAHAARRYADHYLGVSADERAWYARLGVDPYTDNLPLQRAVQHLAHVETATSLGLRIASLPAIPYAGNLQRVMDAIYTEDPAVLREQRRATLLGYGLSADEIEHFENTAALSPTRQHRLATGAASLTGVTGRDALFRHAAELQSEDEAEIYVSSVEQLAVLHQQRPLSSLLAALRLPGGLLADGEGCVVVAAVESIYWTPLVDAAEQLLRSALPTTSHPAVLYVTGSVSDVASAQLRSRGWGVRPHAFTAPTAAAADTLP